MRGLTTLKTAPQTGRARTRLLTKRCSTHTQSRGKRTRRVRRVLLSACVYHRLASAHDAAGGADEPGRVMS